MRGTQVNINTKDMEYHTENKNLYLYQRLELKTTVQIQNLNKPWHAKIKVNIM